MGLTIEWTKQAASGYSNILKYLDEKWTAKEVAKFEIEIKSFLEQLSEYPELLKGLSNIIPVIKQPRKGYGSFSPAVAPRTKRYL
jgi:plasmid stabilization system protein ParE